VQAWDKQSTIRGAGNDRTLLPPRPFLELGATRKPPTRSPMATSIPTKRNHRKFRILIQQPLQLYTCRQLRGLAEGKGLVQQTARLRRCSPANLRVISSHRRDSASKEKYGELFNVLWPNGSVIRESKIFGP
jgi:hypothetical protein